MEKKCKICGTTKDVNFDGLCKQCYEKSIILKSSEDETNQQDEVPNKLNVIKEKLTNTKLIERLKTISIVFLLFIIFCFAISNNSQENLKLTNQVEELTKQTEDLKNQITNVNSKLDEKSKELNALQESTKTLQDEKAKLEAEKQTLNQEVEQLKTSKANESTTQSSSTKASTANKSTISESEPASTSDSYTVYITDTGKKYHNAGCSYLKKSQHPISKSNAVAQGYTPCSKCNP